MWPLYIAVAFTLVLCVLLCLYRRGKYKPIPGPAGYPVCDNSFQVDGDHIHHNLAEYTTEYGNIFRLKLFGSSVITLTSSHLLNSAFHKSPALKYTNDRSANSSSDVFHKRKHIGCANWSKTTEKLRNIHTVDIQTYFDGKYYFEVIAKEEVKRLHLNLISKPGSDINPHGFLKIFFKNICSILLIGDIIPESDPDREILWDFVDNLFTMVDPSVDGPLKMFPFLRHLPGYYGDIYRATIESRDKVAKRFFTDHKASYVHGRVRGLVDVCIMTQMEEEMKTGTSWLTDDYIKGLIYDTLAAGMTELLKSLRLFMLLMAHHPDVQARISTEIDRVIGSRFPEGCDRQWMPYTHAVMLELWRYGSQTPLAIPHLCNKDIVLEGYLIKKGSVILPNLYGVHHDEAIWGDPWTFRPDRFLDERGAMLPSDHKYLKNIIPFSIGQRACPGQDFARSRIFIGMTSLLQRVQISPPVNSKLPSTDPRLYTKKYPLTEPEFECRILSRENIVI